MTAPLRKQPSAFVAKEQHEPRVPAIFGHAARPASALPAGLAEVMSQVRADALEQPAAFLRAAEVPGGGE